MSETQAAVLAVARPLRSVVPVAPATLPLRPLERPPLPAVGPVPTDRGEDEARLRRGRPAHCRIAMEYVD
ncbi:hypothetical protein [Kitasatospora sp. NPDC093806]|uniref:hypothetical protein n=1 Tax=Kitasatospora sp. NPDC093806 TaxID=3155075 RepID=UPI0034368A3C